jgi:Type IV secretion-system coupling protein DNA-binding domain
MLQELLSISINIAIALSGVLLFVWQLRLILQRRADRMRRTFELSFPAGMDHAQVLAFIRSLSGLPGPRLLQPVQAIVFETYADENGVRNYIHIPGHVNSRVDNLLEEHIDGIGITPIDHDYVATTDWHAVELSMKGVDEQLRVEHARDIATSIRAGFKTLSKGEAAVLQWIVWRDAPRKPTPEAKVKLSDNTFNAIARIGATGEHPDRLIRDVYSGLASSHVYGAQFTKRFNIKVAPKVRKRSGTLIYPIFLNALELSALMGWPLDGSSKHKARPVAPDIMHDTTGPDNIVLGVSNHHKARGRVVTLPVESGDMHVRVMGATGTGKSNFLLNMGVQLMARDDTAFILLEPAGDLAWDMLNRVPKHRIKDVIYFDPTDVDFPVGLNPFLGSDPERITSHVVSVFKNLSGDSWGHQLQRVLTTAVMTTALTEDTLYGTKQLLVNKDYRQTQLRKLKRAQYPLIFQEWDWIDSKADLVVDSSVNRIDSFLASRMVRNVVSQRQGLDFDKIIREHKILLVPLPSARMGQTNASAIGQLIREMAWNAAMRQNPLDRQRSIVMLDEFANFADFSTTKSDPFSEARKYKQQYYIAHQYTEQLPIDVQHTVNKNVATQIVFRLDPEDARRVKDRYKPLTEEDISTLPKFNIAARVMSSTGMAPTVTLMTQPPPPITGFAQEIIANTRVVHAKPVNEVEADILARHKPKEERKRPAIGRVR